MNTKRQDKTYTSEFKTEVIVLVSDQGYTGQKATSALGIANSLLFFMGMYFLVINYFLIMEIYEY